MAKGYIKLDRSITEWEWYEDVNTLKLWIHLLCTVMWKRTEHKGVTLEPGQRIASLRKLSEETRLSLRNIRTAKQHLIDTGEVTVSDTPYGDLITVVNWAKFQGDRTQGDTADDTVADSPSTQHVTQDRHKNEEGEEIKNVYYNVRTPAHDANKEESLANYLKAREEARRLMKGE